MVDVLSLFLGVLLGVVTGITPGLHVNILIPIIRNPILLIGVAVSHTFFDFIPSLLLGVPDESSAIASLPGHRLVLSGKGYSAFILSILGGVLSSLAVLFFVPILMAFQMPRQLTLFMVLVMLATLIMSQRRKLIALSILTLSASLAVFAQPFSGGNLVAFFTGLFGTPTLVYSLMTLKKIPKQRIDHQFNVSLETPFLSALGGILAGLLPGVTSSMSAIFVNGFKRMSDEEKVMFVGGINTVYVLVSVMAIWLVGHPRSGLALALYGSGQDVVIYMFLAISVSALLASSLGSRLFLAISRMDTRRLNLATLGLIALIMFVLYRESLPVFIAASSLGLLAYSAGVNRTVGLGFIIFPILSTYLCGI